MRSSASAVLADLRWRQLARSPSLALLVDLDGTLIEFAPTLEQAVLPADVATLLNHLVETGVRVVIVSGRPSYSIEALRAAVPNAWWVAEHGSWRWDGESCTRPAFASSELDSLVARLQTVLSTTIGIRVEHKARSFCVHWRGVEPAAREEIVAAVEAACDEWLEENPAFERLPGVEMVEIRHRAVHKGSAVRWIREVSPASPIIAMGDDVTDEDMFAELSDGDAAVSVGATPLTADARAESVQSALAFLQWIVEIRSGVDVPLPLTSSPAREHRRFRLLVISNRTPAQTQGRGREVGGLISALEPALRDTDAVWLGWSGQEREHDDRIVIDANERLVRARFDLSPLVRQQFYGGFCNRVLWPLFHDVAARVRYQEGDWAAYVAANERFARHALDLAQRHATVWVHDYHLLLVGRSLRRLGHRGAVGLFLHIPFPTLDTLATSPFASQLVIGMLDFDLVGFQTQGDADNFRAAATAFGPGRVPELGVFPATIDAEYFRREEPDVREVAGLRAALGDRRLILGVDRLDYSKGIPQRLEAYERFLDLFPEWRRQVSFLQVSVPSRAEIPDYAELREHVERLVGRINGRFGDTDWVPVRYLYRSYDPYVLAQLYRLADIALVTPLRDGMNLVAKEFVCARKPEHPGVLVLSKFAGAAQTLTSAVLTNPLHVDGVASDIERALRMPHDERVRRHRDLLASLEREGDAKVWARNFLDCLTNLRPHALD